MPDDPVECHDIEGSAVGPEFVTGLGHERRDHGRGRLGGLPLAKQEPDQASLGERTRSDRLGSTCEPFLGGVVVDVVVDDEGNQYVGVQENGH
jgi:hypothetical protein